MDAEMVEDHLCPGANGRNVKDSGKSLPGKLLGGE
jgi:hypothetical protein